MTLFWIFDLRFWIERHRRNFRPSDNPKSQIQNLKSLTGIALLMLCVLTAPLVADAQPPGKVPRIGILWPGPIAPRMHLWKAFQEGLRQLGYVEEQNITFVIRSPEEGGKPLADLATELVGLKVDVIVTGGTLGPLAAKNATSTIPIVMAVSPDPVGSGLVASLARPGGNVTGLSYMAPDLGGKRLQLLKEVVPRASRVAILWNAANPYHALTVRETEAAARVLGVQLQSLEIRAPEDIDRAFEAAIRGRASALTVVEDPLVNTHRARIVALAAKSRLPAIYGLREVVEAGGLMSYAANFSDLYRRAATYVDKILKGAKPADLPVEQPTRFELVINLKTAKALGLTIPQSILIRADHVIQ
jgi:putative ABC transport system substrate-binding protein